MLRSVGFITAAAAVLLILSGLCKGQDLFQGSAAPLEKPGVAGKAPRYDELLAKYLRCIDGMKRGQDAQLEAVYKLLPEKLRLQEEDFTRREAEIVKHLLQYKSQSGAKLLDPARAEENDDNDYFVPSSAVSARIFAQACKAGLVNTAILASCLGGSVHPLANEWLSVLQDLAAKAESGSALEFWTAMAFYKSGIEKEKNRLFLMNIATEKGAPVPLRAIFFETDPKTFKPRAVETPENLALLKRIAAKDFKVDMRAVCAEYVVALGDKALAEEIILGILAEPYPLYSETSVSIKSVMESSRLEEAKASVLGLAFYDLQNETAFKAVFDRTGLGKTQLSEFGFAVKRDRPEFADMEIETARNLMRNLENRPNPAN